MTTIKAERATIKLGDIELDVFQLPDGSYKWSSKNIADSINIRHSRISEICSSKRGKSLIGSRFESADLSPSKLKGSGAGDINGYSTEVVVFIWAYEAMKGNKLAQALLAASVKEALERRADAAFGIKRTEEEYNERLAFTVNGSWQRIDWANAIDEYIRTHEVSEAYKQSIYGYVRDEVYKAVLGMTAKEFRESRGLPADARIEDHITTEQLIKIDCVESIAGRQVQHKDICPKQALKDAISLIC